MAAPLLLMTMRVIQGFSLGGEFTGSMVYTTELASPLMRGIVSSSTAAGITLGFILGSATGVARQAHARPRRGRCLGLAHSVHRERRVPRDRLSCAAGSRRPRRAEGRGRSVAPLRVPDRRLAADRADVRHRRDDECGVLPDVHVRGRTAESLAQAGARERAEFQLVNTISLFVVLFAKVLGGWLSDRDRPSKADDRADGDH